MTRQVTGGFDESGAGPDGFDLPIHRMCALGFFKGVQGHVDADESSMHKRNSSSQTPLHIVCQIDAAYTIAQVLEIVDLLTKDGSDTLDINAKDAFGKTALHYAVKSGRLDLVRKLFDLRSDPSIRDNGLMLPIHEAALRGRYDVTEYFLAQGSGVTFEAQGLDGRTLLSYAAEGGSIPVAALLISCGANVLPVQGVDSALHHGVRSGNIGMVEVLLEELENFDPRVWIDSVNHEKQTVLHLAANGNQVDIFRNILHKGANVNAVDAHGKTPLHYAALKDNMEAVKLLISYKHKTSVKDKDAMTPLHYAAINGNVDVVGVLIDARHNVNARASDGMTPLHYAALNGNRDVIELLINSGAKIDIVDKYSKTSLHYIAQSKDADKIIALISKKSDSDFIEKFRSFISKHSADFQDQDKMTPLHYAALHANTEAVLTLVGGGADIGKKDEHGRLPVHYAALRGDAKMIKSLCGVKDEVNTADNAGITPLMIAILRNDSEIVKALISAGANINTADKEGKTYLHHAIVERDIDVIKALIDSGADVNATDKNGQTPLHYASKTGDANIIGELGGARFDMADSNGTLPIHYAAESGSETALPIVISLSGALCVNATDDYQNTALHIICANGYEALARSLVETKSDEDKKSLVSATNREIQTPLHIACANGDVKLAKVLIDAGANINCLDMYYKSSKDYALESGNEELVRIISTKEEVEGSFERPQIRSFIPEESFAALNGDVESFIEQIDRVDQRAIRHDVSERTFLHYAAWYGRIDFIIRIAATRPELISSSAERRDRAGLLPIHYAARYNRADVVRYLYENSIGAQMDEFGMLPLHHGAATNSADVVRMLIDSKRDEVRLLDKSGRSAIHYAAMKASPEVCRLILDAGSSIYECDKYGRTPLHYGAQRGDEEIVQMLLTKSVRYGSLDVVDHSKNAPIHYAALNGHSDIVLMMIDAGADLDVRDIRDNAPLHLIVQYCPVDEAIGLVHKIIQKGADINACNFEPATALFKAAQRGEPEIVKALLSRGADVSIKCRGGNALEEVLRIRRSLVEPDPAIQKFEEVLDVIVSAFIQKGICSTIINYSVLDSVKLIQNLHSRGADLNAIDEDGKTALYTAIQKGEPEIVKALIDCGADTKFAAQGEKFALDMAVEIRNKMYSKSDFEDIRHYGYKNIKEIVEIIAKHESREIPSIPVPYIKPVSVSTGILIGRRGTVEDKTKHETGLVDLGSQTIQTCEPKAAEPMSAPPPIVVARRRVGAVPSTSPRIEGISSVGKATGSDQTPSIT